MASAPRCWTSTTRLSFCAPPSASLSTFCSAASRPHPPRSRPLAAASPPSSSIIPRPPLSSRAASSAAAAPARRGASGAYRGARQLSDKENLARRKADDAKRKANREYHYPKLAGNYPQFSLCDAMRILRAAEVGHPPKSVKYELFVRMKTYRSGPVVKSSVQLPHPLQGDERIAVICPEGSKVATEAIACGAVLVGEEPLFKAIRAGDISFTKLLCHEGSEKALMKAQLGRILGPKKLMPSRKTGTITANLRAVMKDTVGSVSYRERAGVARMPIGQLNFTPTQLKENVQHFMADVKRGIRKCALQSPKSLHEIVLSTTHGPGISLNGLYIPTDERVTEEDLAGPM